ncbi:MAG: FprA family A-type flavoprotein [Spirochaetales bacterium]|nr:FprA family A-type flavoprotein [Spirochaetales bacterium]
MNATTVTDGIFRLSANAGSEILFESMWPLPHGVSMNSYIVKGDRCAIIDGVCGWDGVPETLLGQLEALGIRPQDIDYVVLNHLEPDHTGWLEAFRRLREDFTLVASPKGLELARALYGIEGKARAVAAGDRLDLGGGRELEFVEIPNVHWPETIATYEHSSGTLFPCDAFGSFGSIGEAPYDDQLDFGQLEFYEGEALRYYANILATFSGPVGKAIEKLQGFPIRILAPGHGLVWRRDPKRIIDLYRRLVSYARGPAEPRVTVIWGSMYGNTEKAVEAVVAGLEAGQVAVHAYQVPQDHASFVLADAWRSSAIAIGAPTYEYRMFPPMAAALDELGRKRVLRKKALRFGSFGWSGGAQKELEEIQERWRMGWEFLEPVDFKGAPRPADLRLLEQRGRELAAAARRYADESAGAEAAS